MATHSSVLAWRIPGTGGPGGLPSMGSHGVRHDWSDLEAYRGRKAWWYSLKRWREIALFPVFQVPSQVFWESYYIYCRYSVSYKNFLFFWLGLIWVTSYSQQTDMDHEGNRVISTSGQASSVKQNGGEIIMWETPAKSGWVIFTRNKEKKRKKLFFSKFN